MVIFPLVFEFEVKPKVTMTAALMARRILRELIDRVYKGRLQDL
jgi:hypothetical protein